MIFPWGNFSDPLPNFLSELGAHLLWAHISLYGAIITALCYIVIAGVFILLTTTLSVPRELSLGLLFLLYQLLIHKSMPYMLF